MPVVGKDFKPEDIEILKGIELVAIKCIRNMPKIYKKENVIAWESKWRLFKVKFDPDAPEILIFDNTGYISKGNSNYVLVPIDDKERIETWLKEVPEDVKDKIKSIVWKHGLSEKNLAESLTTILMEPIPRLKNPEVISKLKKEGWDKFIESAISPGAEKDHRINLVFKMHLLRGITQRHNPHILLATNSGTGKSTYYDMVGLRIDKASANRLIGYSDAQKPYPGTIDNLYIPLCIEQIESQEAPQILRFLQNFMESGKAKSETGAGGFTVRGTCPIIITANPTGYDVNRIDTFRALIDHLTGNLMALGRRFGIIIYGIDYGKVAIKKAFSEVDWRISVQKFRSVEEYILPLINGIFKDEKVLEWLEKPLPDYEKRGKRLIEDITDTGVKEFLTTHLELAYPHLRGGALNCAIIDFIPRLVKVKVTCKEDGLLVLELLAKADKYLKEIIAINLESVANMASLEEKITGLIFEQLPKYLQELFRTLQNYTARFGYISGQEILIEKLQNYLPKDSVFGYVSQITNALDNRTIETINNYNRLLEKYWRFRIVLKEKMNQKGIYAIEFVQ